MLKGDPTNNTCFAFQVIPRCRAGNGEERSPDGRPRHQRGEVVPTEERDAGEDAGGGDGGQGRRRLLPRGAGAGVSQHGRTPHGQGGGARGRLLRGGDAGAQHAAQGRGVALRECCHQGRETARNVSVG